MKGSAMNYPNLKVSTKYSKDTTEQFIFVHVLRLCLHEYSQIGYSYPCPWHPINTMQNGPRGPHGLIPNVVFALFYFLQAPCLIAYSSIKLYFPGSTYADLDGKKNRKTRSKRDPEQVLYWYKMVFIVANSLPKS